MSTDWEQELQGEREQKDEFFADHPHSPIPGDEQPTFDGLEYYSPDAGYRFELPLHEFNDHETLTVETTADGQQTYVCWGEFRFELDSEEYTLSAYKQNASEDQLWVPFRDETNGQRTYGAGRYLDLEAEKDLTTDEAWILDFNRAYSPFCAYSEAYECPLVPPENHLSVRIEAGEQIPD
jgi:uncharacterized protein (DUF1684 family)